MPSCYVLGVSTVRLFVYGSLKAGFRHHDVLGGARFLARVVTARGYRLVRLAEYPALVRPPPGEARGRGAGLQGVGVEGVGVEGELYELPLSRIPELDAFEDCPELYQREFVSLEDGTEAFAYSIDAARAAGLEEVSGGSWTRELDAERWAQRSDMGL